MAGPGAAGPGDRAQAGRRRAVPSVSDYNPEQLTSVGVPHILREYALLADGERGVLVGPRGDYAWMCFPCWDSDACFATLIGGQGTYAVTPEARFVWGGYYEHGLIWRSRWTTDDGVVECREALALPAERGRAVLLRRILAQRGSARVRVILDLRAEFGARSVKRLRRRHDGIWAGQLGRRSHAVDRRRRGRAAGRRTRRQAAGHDSRTRRGRRPRPRPGARHRRPTRSRRRTPITPGVRPRPRGRTRCRRSRDIGARRDAPPLLRRVAGSDQQRRRHGGRGHDVAARAGPGGP